jgi:hypothetical protein
VKQLQAMKQFKHLSAALLAMTFVGWAAEPSPDVKETVLNAERAWKTAVLNRDRGALDKLLSPDLSYTHSSAKTQTKEQFIEDVMGGGTGYKSIEFEDTKLRQYGTTVVITQSAMIMTVQTGANHLYLTEVWAKEAGRWQMVTRQATKLP